MFSFVVVKKENEQNYVVFVDDFLAVEVQEIVKVGVVLVGYVG